MIGLALVSMASVVGASFKDSFTEQIDRGITADYFLSTDDNVSGFSPDVATTIASQPVVDTVGTFRFGQAQVNGKTKSLAATQPEALERVVNLGIISGGPQDLEDNGLMVHEDPAEDLGLSVGDTVEMTFPVGGTETMNVVGIYTDDVAELGNWIISQSTFARHYPPGSPARHGRGLHDQGRRGSRRGGGHRGPAVPGLPRGQHRGPGHLQGEPGEPDRPAPGGDQHAARHVAVRRRAWHRDHAGAVGLRADPGARAVARSASTGARPAAWCGSSR